MATTPKTGIGTKSTGRSHRKSFGQFKSPCGMAFKSPVSAGMASSGKETEESMAASIADLKNKLTQNQEEITQLSQMGYREEELQTHIQKLHEYNEIKDTGQMLLGRIATMQGVRTKDLYEKYGLELED